MKKYTIEYCKNNFVAIRCPTKEIFDQVLIAMDRPEWIKRDLWSKYREDTKLSFGWRAQAGTYERNHMCYGDDFEDADVIDAKIFFADNGITLETYCEIY